MGSKQVDFCSGVKEHSLCLSKEGIGNELVSRVCARNGNGNYRGREKTV